MPAILIAMLQSMHRHPLRWVVSLSVAYITLLVIWLVAVSVSVYTQADAYPFQRVMEAHWLIHGLLPFDSEHFYNIATHGYLAHPFSIAFFPLYPLLTRAVSIFLSADIALLFISWLSTIATALMVFLWAREELRYRKLPVGATPYWTLALLAAYPFSFFFVMGYTEGLFIALTAASLYFYRTNRPVLSGIFAALSGITRVQGILIVIFFGLEYLSHKKWRDMRRLTPLLIAPLGLIGFMTYQYFQYGTPFMFIEIQKAWSKFPSNYLEGLSMTISPLTFLFTAIFGAMLFLCYRTLGRNLTLYVGSSLLVMFISGSLVSVNRYLLSAFPLFLALALVFPSWPRWLRAGTFALSIFLLLVFGMLVSQVYFLG